MAENAVVAEVVVCAGPPNCTLEGDAAIANADAGCPRCKIIRIHEDGSETETYRKPN